MKKIDLQKSLIANTDNAKPVPLRRIETRDRKESEESREYRSRTDTRRPRVKRNFLIQIIIVFIVLTSLSFGGYFYYKLRQIERNSNGETAKREVKDLLAKVAELYLIPTGEEPTIATVSDPSALKDQAFFDSSQKGDKVVIFTKAGKAVLYRPSINKIIETAPINNNAQTTSKPAQESGQSKDKTTF